MAGQVMRKCSGRDSSHNLPDVLDMNSKAVLVSSGVALKCCNENMAPGKTHVKQNNKFQVRKNTNSGVKKAKNSSLPKKKLKERTLQQLEEVNKSFTAVHDTLLVRNKSQDNAGTEKQACVKANKEKLLPANNDVTQEELSQTVEDIANL